MHVRMVLWGAWGQGCVGMVVYGRAGWCSLVHVEPGLCEYGSVCEGSVVHCGAWGRAYGYARVGLGRAHECRGCRGRREGARGGHVGAVGCAV